MINRKLLIVLMLTAAFFQTAVAQEVTKTGTTSAKFLSIGMGPRANAMGGAYSSVAGDATAMYWNPAGIADVPNFQAIFTYTKMFADINVNYIGLVIPAGTIGTFGLGVTALNIGDMDVTTEYYPEGTGEKFTAGSYAFGLSFARYITQDFAVGFTVKYIHESIFNSSANGFGFDIGTTFNTPFWGIKFASSISNYGSKMKMTGDDLLVRHDPDPQRAGNNQTIDAYYSTEEFELPLRLQIGISREIILFDDNKLILAVDATHPNDNDQSINVGGELSFFNNMISLRGGYKSLFLKDSQEGLTLGAGIHYDGLSVFRISVDYSYQKFEYLDNIHSFGVILGF